MDIVELEQLIRALAVVSELMGVDAPLSIESKEFVASTVQSAKQLIDTSLTDVIEPQNSGILGASSTIEL